MRSALRLASVMLVLMLFVPEIVRALVRLTLALLTAVTHLVGTVDPWAVPAQVQSFAP